MLGFSTRLGTVAYAAPELLDAQAHRDGARLDAAAFFCSLPPRLESPRLVILGLSSLPRYDGFAADVWSLGVHAR